MLVFYLFLFSAILLLSGCDRVWNNPYPSERFGENALFSAFSERPKHLDPAKSYSSSEWVFVQSVYDSPLQYHYLKRPYVLEPNIAKKMPELIFYDKNHQILLNNTTESVAYSDYIIDIKANTFYQPHPAFATKNLNLSAKEIAKITTINDIKMHTTRELVASDFVHQIKRLAHPGLYSPVLSVMQNYLVGIDDFAKQLQAVYKKNQYLDLTKFDFVGAKVLSKYRYRIRIKEHQPQFKYWLAMPFFTAIPPEADKFYAQKGLVEKNISLDWYPIGTSAFYLTINNPNKEMVLTKNPNFHKQTYPSTGNLSDLEQGLLQDKGKLLPLTEKVYFSLETESIPYWHKFNQGYYDKVAVASDYFDQAVEFDKKGNKIISKDMQKRQIQLLETEGSIIYYGSFNFLDKIVGGYSKRSRYLRQAIAIAIDTRSYIDIFSNGQASIAHHPIPKGFFGFDSNTNAMLYNGDTKKNLVAAKKLLALAGYKNGIDSTNGKPLTLVFSTPDVGPSAGARLSWIKKQFDKLGINLIIDSSSYSTFLDKLEKGDIQLFEAGWGADYPDAENFLFLFYSKNAKVKYGGDNSANYNNPEFDKLFEQMKNMSNNEQRAQIIKKMINIWQADIPWAWGYVPNSSILVHGWLSNQKLNAFARNTLKYQGVNVKKRKDYQQKYNQASLTPLLLSLVVLLLIIWQIKQARAKHYVKNLSKNL